MASLRLAALFAALMLAGCGDDGGTDAGGADAGGRDAAADAGGSDAGDFDAGADAGGTDAARPRRIQCRTADECIATTGSGCFASRPGGVCTGCGDPGDSCPSGTECIMGGTSGATECAFPCGTDTDCHLATYCAELAMGRYCQPQRCGDGLPPCPAPYTFCRETTAPLFECARPMCTGDPMSCPPPLVCPAAGGFCMEPG